MAVSAQVDVPGDVIGEAEGSDEDAAEGEGQRRRSPGGNPEGATEPSYRGIGQVPPSVATAKPGEGSGSEHDDDHHHGQEERAGAGCDSVTYAPEHHRNSQQL